jgi:hypothetical protein
MGLFKSMKDLAGVTKQAKQLQEEQQQKAGYKPVMGGMMNQMGDMLSQANQSSARWRGRPPTRTASSPRGSPARR